MVICRDLELVHFVSLNTGYWKRHMIVMFLGNMSLSQKAP